jgi:two-component system, cell cycle response regulator
VADSDDKTLTSPIGHVLAEMGKRSAALVVLSGSGIGKMFRLVKGESIVGRSAECTIVLDDESVSRQHCKLLRLKDEFHLLDLGSKNGTYCNGERVKDIRILKDGDKIRVSTETVLKFTLQDEMDEAAQQALYDSAIRDGLTGAFNKKFLIESLQKEFAFAVRHDHVISVLMMDIDHFKKVNDQYGHAAGDHALVKLAGNVHEAIRVEDVFARYGGEEFALVLRGLTEDVAVAVADRLRRRIEALDLRFNGVDFKMTISIGVATHVGDLFKSPEELIQAADKYLYSAKSSGRNRVNSRWLNG